MEIKKDVILIATKINSLKHIARSIGPLLNEDTVIVSLQNGICEEYLSSLFGCHRIIGCIVGWGATVYRPGDLKKTSEGNFVIGTLNNCKTKHFEFVKEILGKAAPVEVTNNIMGDLYSKLIINACITTLGAISGLTLGKMLSKWKFRNIFIDVIRESVNVARAKGIKIEKYAGKMDFYDFADNTGFFATIKKHLIISMVGFKYRKLKSSSLQSLETGKQTEIDFLNGYIVAKAEETDLETPLNKCLIKLVKEIESGIRHISPQNFELPFFNQYSY